MDKVDQILSELEKSYKRLAIPTVMLAAVYFMIHTAEVKGKDIDSIMLHLVIVSLSAVAFTLASGIVALAKFSSMDINKLSYAIVSISYLISAIFLIMVGLNMAVGEFT
ncbi:MAG TPA: hypothetical protein EYM37_04360 [Methylophaga aminisulfidivorans]|uniref:Uncharacterized protein n=1 Tax=Methylophaga aminisulfidivorans MP TaxID=1026882 RepID=F5T361_9GAMM|nr:MULTISPECIES: hypothetical protein [Methylophaga]EGL53487.1 hypothetical protein MAMP_01148 [Methylophaga aminisulfidivorans MP]HIC47794.1 hypothetical protein [Methylophaga sp.]HIM39154.1 hypothetical protein [Methylophaga aminisulfidivorans]